MPDLNALISAKSAVEADLLKLPGVTGVGVGSREKGGQLTDELVIHVYVERKRPLAEVPAESRIPTEIGGFKTDVIEKGYDVHLSLENYHQRPIVGGLEITRVGPWFKNYYGSICCFVNKFRKTDTGAYEIYGDAYLLSAAHVLVPESAVDDRVYQPRPFGYTNCIADKDDTFYDNIVGRDQFGKELRRGVDAGLARLQNGTPWRNDVHNVGPIINIDDAQDRDKVRKQGRTTGLTSGMVFDVSYTSYGSPQLSDLLLIRPDSDPNVVYADMPKFCDHGDSGGPLFKDIPGSPNEVLLVGIVTRGDEKSGWGIACKIRTVFEKLSIQLAAHEGTQEGGSGWFAKIGF